MTIDYPQNKNGLFILSAQDFDDIADGFYEEKCPEIKNGALPVDIEKVAEECLYLTVIFRPLASTGSVLGLVTFGDCELVLRDGEGKKSRCDYPEGTILVEQALLREGLANRRRFTIAHEVSHWLLHRSYYSPTNKKYSYYIACRAGNIERVRRRITSDDHWAEWQADQLAAALLMPKAAFVRHTHEAVYETRSSMENLRSGQNRDAVRYVARRLSEKFMVSHKAVEIRLRGLGLISEGSSGLKRAVEVTLPK